MPSVPSFVIEEFFLSTRKTPGKLYISDKKILFPTIIPSSESLFNLEPGFYKRKSPLSGFRYVFVPKSRLYVFVSPRMLDSGYLSISKYSGLVVDDLYIPLCFHRHSYFEYLQRVFS
jgi:hypothetical protein